jgi:hypothetical protein
MAEGAMAAMVCGGQWGCIAEFLSRMNLWCCTAVDGIGGKGSPITHWTRPASHMMPSLEAAGYYPLVYAPDPLVDCLRNFRGIWQVPGEASFEIGAGIACALTGIPIAV